MTTPSEFFNKLKALKPDHDLTSGVAFIAILQHDKLPNDRLQQTDALWIKCPKGKELSSLLKAYKKKHPLAGDLVLRHNFKVVDETTKISTLLTLPSDDFVALEAIPVDDLGKRMNHPTPRTILAEVTNIASQTRSKNDVSSKDAAAFPTKSPVAHTPGPINTLSGNDQHAKTAISRAEAKEFRRPSRDDSPKQNPEAIPQYGKEESTRSVQPKDDPEPPKDDLFNDNNFHAELENGPSVPQDGGPTRLTMSELFDGRTPEQLEKSVQKGAELLTGIQQILREHPHEETNQWIQTLEKVQSQAARSRTVVGVVGATGAGKSSVINAMLDEERLVPTNCMRACTAVVTEISYNYDNSIPYRAEIEFISREDWLKMLTVLFQDLLDGSGQVSRECTNEDSECGIAYAQVKAVYPKLTKEEIENVPIEHLMAHDNVKCLGTTRNVEAHEASDFYKKLQNYVDSKEKAGVRKDNEQKEKRKPREMEFWPLIRVVRIHVIAPALATGAVIVDLPGVHDSNQARAAVAQGYMKQCTGLWIVAPITRAVDDKSAKNLLGDSFKRQLKMDGGYSSVTFICSKTDDISITEAQDSLGLEDEFGPMMTKSEDLKKKKISLEQQIEHLKATKSNINSAIEAQDEEVEIWEKLQEDCQAGQTVYQPKPPAQKRKRVEVSIPSRKKSKYAKSASDDDFTEGDSNSDGESYYPSSVTGEDRGTPLTGDDISSKIAELRLSKKEGRRQKIQIDEEMMILRKQIEQIDKEHEAVDVELSAKCISGRNEYSRAAIRQDYASGIRELDHELAEEADAAKFNPEVDARDYDEVARNLPVFCVSSRAYQKLKGRLQRDKTPPGFKDIDQTEVPALQAHCVQLTTADRQTSARRFLNSTFQFLNSLRLWASKDGTGTNLTDDQVKHEVQILKDRLKKLDTALEKSVTNVVKGIDSELEKRIYDVFPKATAAAKSLANDTVRQWGAPVNRENRAEGGLYWATYKAVVRRDGCFSNALRSVNFNAELVDPILRSITGPWESVFARRIPSILSGLPLDVSGMLKTFHEEVECRAARKGASIAAFHILKQQLPGYKETLKDAMIQVRSKITEKQREINREFEPRITSHMLEVYETCVRESGPGQYARMRAHMDGYVEREKDSMFERSVQHVQALIGSMLKGIKEDLLTRVDGVFMAIQRDYTGVFCGSGTSQTTKILPREQRALRKSVLDIVDSAELVFKRAVGLEAEPKNQTPDPEIDVAGTEAFDRIKKETNDDTNASAETTKIEHLTNPKFSGSANPFSLREQSPVPVELPQQSHHDSGSVKAVKLEQDSI